MVLLMTLTLALACLTEAIYFEARSESIAGQIAVAQVIMNRVSDDRWPNDTCSVVHQKHQFSYYWDGKPEVYKDKKSKQKAARLAEMIYFGTVIDITDGSLYYHTLDSNPDWDWSKIKRTMTLDNHIFYKDK